ncbi:MAG: hypothetical protein Q7T18_04680 [Sedimentisphaerales bacterium]|nr:hypothetical protein [Sedimentisphaerales bacterium]
MLIDSAMANEFLASYKSVLAEVNGGKKPKNVNEFGKCQKRLYSNSAQIAEYKSVDEDFRIALSKAIYGQFIFLKKYKSWYAFQHVKTGRYFAALGLTSPIEEMVEDFSIIETALVPFKGRIVCDGLIVNNNVLLGKNMMTNCRNGYLQAKQSGDLIQTL